MLIINIFNEQRKFIANNYLKNDLSMTICYNIYNEILCGSILDKQIKETAGGQCAELGKGTLLKDIYEEEVNGE
jgi:hypothetical protein